MRSYLVALALFFAPAADGFTTTTTTTNSIVARSRRSIETERYGYVPDGFKSAEEYQKFRNKEREEQKAKNLGGLGPRGFKSRSMQSFQEALERGEAEHLLPMFNAKEKLRKGQIKMQDIPYMQRGGSWDQSDVKGAKTKRWLKSDKEYASGGFKKEQSVSIFGYGEGLDWTGKNARKGPSENIPGKAISFGRNYKAPNVNNMKGVKVDDDKPRKKLFGLF